MGTKVQCKSYLPGYFSMGDLNQDSNGCSWPPYYGDKMLTNGQYYNGFLPRAVADTYSGCDKDVVKRTMLEHEAIFKSQVYELHRLYRIQRDLMDEVKRKELHKNRMAVESSLSSSLMNSQITSEDARKWQIPSFPLASSFCARPSIPGVEDIHSPLSSMQGSSKHAGHLPLQNGGSSKEVELLDSRPRKVRRKMIDLQLPAEAYIDTEEEAHCRDLMISATSSYLPNESQKITAESGVKLFIDENEKIGCQKEALRSDSFLRRTNGLADLNEPIPTEETNTSRYMDLLGCAPAPLDAGIKGHELFTKLKSRLPGFPKEVSLDPYLETSKETPKNRHFANNENDRGWFSLMSEAGPSKSVSQGLQLEKSPLSSQPIQVLFNKAHEDPPFLLTDQSKVDVRRERRICGLEVSERNRDISSNNLPESTVASSKPSSFPIASSSNLFNSWSHSVSSWENPRSSLNEKPILVQTHPFLNLSDSLSRNSQTSAQTYGIFGDGWHLNNNPRPNSSLESELPKQSGFFNGSSSGSKEPLVHVPSIGYNFVNYGNTNLSASEDVISHGSVKLYNGSSSMDMKSAKDVILNGVLSNSLQDAVPQRILEVSDEGREHEDPLAVLPWLRAKPSCKNEATNTATDLNVGELSFLQSSLNQPVNKNETASSQMFDQNLKSGSGSNNVEASRVERNDFANRKIRGFPFLEKPHIFKNESSSLTSPSVSVPPTSEVEVEENKKNRELDINLPCDDAIPDLSQQGEAEALLNLKKSDVKGASFRHQIDLNSCVSEDEASFMPTAASSNVKTSGIDLEAPIVPETEIVNYGEECREKVQETPLQSPQHKTELLDDGVIRVAAQAIVAISSYAPQIHLDDTTCNSSEASVKDPLNWFVEIVSSCGDDFESKLDAALRGNEGENNDDSSSKELDYFEYMTLKLTETKEEDYMPPPLVPESLKIEETGNTVLSNRSRKGQARRGRQRRDFQRDILPGLASLSRHEVTEDLQTFGGMMRATGHSWSAFTRRNSTRNGSARGRRRAVVSSPPRAAPTTTACTPLVQQLVNIEVVTLDDRSLTGWGKTTRRPRRERCPAGNPPALLT